MRVCIPNRGSQTSTRFRPALRLLCRSPFGAVARFRFGVGALIEAQHPVGMELGRLSHRMGGA
jgi:hypothetical protein